MPYWRMFYHIVWATKGRHSLITPEVETVIFPAIIHKSRELGAFVYALNGTMDHVHLVAAIPPRIGVGEFVGQVKGRATHAANTALYPHLEISMEDDDGPPSVLPDGAVDDPLP